MLLFTTGMIDWRDNTCNQLGLSACIVASGYLLAHIFQVHLKKSCHDDKFCFINSSVVIKSQMWYISRDKVLKFADIPLQMPVTRYACLNHEIYHTLGKISELGHTIV